MLKFLLPHIQEVQVGLLYIESFYDDIVLSSFLLVSNGDYIDVAVQKLIEKCDNMTCLDVTIYDDNVVEIIETFEVRLIVAEGFDSSISVDGSAEITIIDDDSEFHILKFTYFYVILV